MLGGRGDVSYRVDEVFVGGEGLCFKLGVQRGISRREKAVDRGTGSWGFELACADNKSAGIIAVANLPGSAHRLVMFRELLRVIECAPCANLEVPERMRPGFHRVGRNTRVPVQFVNRKITVFDAGQDRSQFHAFHAGLRLEFPSVPLHVHAARYTAPKRTDKEIRYLKAGVVQVIGAAADQAFGVKDLVG